MSREARNVDVLKLAYERWHGSKGQTADHWMGLFAEKVEFKSLAEGTQGMEFTAVCRSRGEVVGYFEGLAKDWSMNYYRIDEYVAQGDCVVAIGE